MQAMNADAPKNLVVGAVASLVVSLASMILLRDQVRQTYLGQSGYEIVKWVEPDWLTMSLFGVLLIVAVIAVVWMVALLARSGRQNSATGTGS